MGYMEGGGVDPTQGNKGWEEFSAQDSQATQCPYCEKVLKYKGNLRIHIRDHHTDARAVHSCQECGKTFGSSGSLRDHKSKYHRFQYPANKSGLSVLAMILLGSV